MASDNVLPSKSWLKQMVGSLLAEPSAVGAYPIKYAYKKKDTSLNRYFALLGANDPVAWYLKKADRHSYLANGWNLSGRAVFKKNYYLVEFNENNIPTLGDNGMLVWKHQLKLAQVDQDHFFHIDVFLDLVKLGMNKFVVVDTTIFHDTGEKFYSFLKKRYRYITKLYLNQRQQRRYFWIRDFLGLVKVMAFVFYALSLVGPVLFSIKGFFKKPDWAWFWHLPISVSLVFVYGFAVGQKAISSLFNKLF
jgi:hypothetical protein